MNQEFKILEGFNKTVLDLKFKILEGLNKMVLNLENPKTIQESKEFKQPPKEGILAVPQFNKSTLFHLEGLKPPEARHQSAEFNKLEAR